MGESHNTRPSTTPLSSVSNVDSKESSTPNFRVSHQASLENGIETEEEGGETDDEPTIRGPSSADSETQSLCTIGSEDVYSEAEDDRPQCQTPENNIAMSP